LNGSRGQMLLTANELAGQGFVVAAIDAISARLTPDSLRAMMGRMKVDGASPEIVANEFLAGLAPATCSISSLPTRNGRGFLLRL